MKGRNSQVSRIYRILSLLEVTPLGLTVVDLVSKLRDRGFDVGKRTVYRDLDALRVAGFPIAERGKSDDQGTLWALERNTKVNHHLILDSKELLGLYLAKSVLAPLKETPFYQDLVTTFQKIEDMLGSKSQGFLKELASELHFEPNPQWGLGIAPEVVDTIRAACMEKQMLTMVYASVNSGTTSQRTVGPHFLYFAKGSLYFVAEDMKDNVVKVFSVPRIASASLLDEEYTGEATDPKSLFASAFGVFKGGDVKHVKIIFAPPVATFIAERQWHASQSVVKLDQGLVQLEMDVAISPEVVQWVLGFGSAACVLEPVELIERIQREAQLTLNRYQTRKVS
jgi:predicted DNA-binding transcriptional regulator YafY